MTTLVACSHGTADPFGQEAVRSLVDAVRALLPGMRVAHAVVDVEQPRLEQVLALEAANGDVVVVPLLLSVGYHTAIDISRAVGAHPNVQQTAPLGTHPLITEVLVDRLVETVGAWWRHRDHVVLAAAGSSNPDAAREVEMVAELLQARIPVPLTVGYASASVPRVSDAVAAARTSGAARVIAASHVLAPGFFAGLVRASGADLVTAPLGPDARIAAVIAERFSEASALV
ncbi:sirohydrochlorin chelatase [Microbacterium sp.]|uniref:sirohydrochlorin chelatase n=1 Tax=Microbacterium sp. TaxID=51671 RepID=UPI003A930E1A